MAGQHERPAQLAASRRAVQRCAAIGVRGIESRATVEQQHGHLVVTKRQPGVERRVAALGAVVGAVDDGVDVRAVIEQPGRHFDVALGGGQVQQRPAVQAHVEIRAASRQHVEDGQRVGGDLHRVVHQIPPLPRVFAGACAVVGARGLRLEAWA